MNVSFIMLRGEIWSMPSRPPFRLKRLVPSFGLRVRPILDLEPRVAVVLIDSHLSLRDDPFEISLTDVLKELLTGAVDVLGVQ